MSNYRRARDGRLYFFTLATDLRRPLLTQAELRNALRLAIEQVRMRYPFRIHAWVLLPEHLHCIWELPEEDADYARRWSLIKRQTSQQLRVPATVSLSRHLRRECGLWQRRFWEHQIRDQYDYQRHLDYLHWNPVKHGLVSQVADWPWSSFHRLVRQGVYPADWGGCPDGDETGFGE